MLSVCYTKKGGQLVFGYLHDLLAVVWVDHFAFVVPSIQHLEVTPVLVDGLLFGSFPLRSEIGFADPV